MVDYTSLSIEQPTGDRFRDAAPEDLNQSEFLALLLDQYEGTTTTDTTGDHEAVLSRLDDLERQLGNVPEDTVGLFERRLR